MWRAVTLGWFGLLVACAEPEPRQHDPLAPRTVRDVESWSLMRAGERLGRMRLVEIADPAGPIRRFYVDNPSGKMLGFVDGEGRVFRYELFATEESFDGMYPMREAVARLLDVEGEVAIIGADGQPAEAALKGRR